MSTQKVDSVNCPQCQARSKIVVQQVIDAQDLVMKSAFLQKRVHSVYCPQCRAVLIPAVPTLYYDSEKRLVLVFAPYDSQLAESAPEWVIAQLTTMMRTNLPAEQEDLAQIEPRVYSSLNEMVDAILVADGIDLAALKVQEAKAHLIETMLQAPNEAALKEQVTTHAEQLDSEFFEILSAYMQAAHMRGDQAGAQTFLTLRTLLGQWIANGTQIIAAIDANLGLVAIQSREELLERLRNASTDQERAELVANAHVLIDQAFFALINRAIDQAVGNGDSATIKRLKALSATIAELKRDYLARNQATIERAAKLFQSVVQSDTPDHVLKQRLDEVDEAFFVVLGANIERARRQGQSEPARALELIGQFARTLLQQRQVAKY